MQINRDAKPNVEKPRWRLYFILIMFVVLFHRMSRHREWDLKCKVYVGNLGNNTARGDLEASFSKYGALKNVWVARNPPGFAFVEYEDPRDAEDAVRAMDGS